MKEFFCCGCLVEIEEKRECTLAEEIWLSNDEKKAIRFAITIPRTASGVRRFESPAKYSTRRLIAWNRSIRSVSKVLVDFGATIVDVVLATTSPHKKI